MALGELSPLPSPISSVVMEEENKRSVNAPVAKRPWRQPIKRRQELKEGRGIRTSNVHRKMPPRQWNMSHVTSILLSHCVSILMKTKSILGNP